MSISGIGVIGDPVGYETRRTQKNVQDRIFAKQIGNAASTQSSNFTLHISNEKDGKAIGSMVDNDSSVTVYKTKDFDMENPVYKVKVWNTDGNVTERLVDISKVDPNNCDEIDMFAYSSHLTDSGKCPEAQRAFIGAKLIYDNSNSYNNLFGKENWLDIVKEMMQMQYDAGNLKDYMNYKKFWDFLQ